MSVNKLASALAQHDYFGAAPDESRVCIDHDNCLYELEAQDGSGNLTLADLRALANVKAGIHAEVMEKVNLALTYGEDGALLTAAELLRQAAAIYADRAASLGIAFQASDANA